MDTEAQQVACPRALSWLISHEDLAVSTWSPWGVSPIPGSCGITGGSFTYHFLPLQIKYHEEFEKSRMGPSGGEGMEPERRDSQDSGSYRRPQEQQQPHHIPTSTPGEPEACAEVEDLRLGQLQGGEKPHLHTHPPSGPIPTEDRAGLGTQRDGDPV